MRAVPILLASLITALPLGACGRDAPAAASKGANAPIYSNPADAEIDKATDDAIRTLPVFWSKFNSHSAGYGDFRIKVTRPTDDGAGEERIWMTVAEFTPGKQIKGRLSNEPAQLKKLHQGSLIEVDPSRIVDWMYTAGGKAYGHYTTRALMKLANPEQRAQVAAFLAPTPLEPTSH